MEPLFEIIDLHAEVGGTEILKGVNLTVAKGEVHVIMGPNGSGKSTLSNVIMGHPDYRITGGDIRFEGRSIAEDTPDARARSGIFLSFQNPSSLSGVEMTGFLRGAVKNMNPRMKLKEYRTHLASALESLRMDDEFMKRYVNDGFSGGEKKKNEILQMLLMQPKLALLDEIDSGLDIDALRIIAENIDAYHTTDTASILITHYRRLLDYLKVDHVHIFKNGRIIRSGDASLITMLESDGYAGVSGEPVLEKEGGA